MLLNGVTKLKQKMNEAPVLSLPDFSIPFIVETEASNWGMGAVLQQQGHPIAYISKAFGPRNQALSVYERELLAITFAMTKWRHYLEQGKFFIKTDHESINYLLEQRLHTNLQQRGIPKLLGLDYKILYQKGVANTVADALSRRSSSLDSHQLHNLQSIVIPSWMQHLENSYETDSQATELIQQLSIASPTTTPYQVKNGVLFIKPECMWEQL